MSHTKYNERCMPTKTSGVRAQIAGFHFNPIPGGQQQQQPSPMPNRRRRRLSQQYRVIHQVREELLLTLSYELHCNIVNYEVNRSSSLTWWITLYGGRECQLSFPSFLRLKQNRFWHWQQREDAPCHPTGQLFVDTTSFSVSQLQNIFWGLFCGDKCKTNIDITYNIFSQYPVPHQLTKPKLRGGRWGFEKLVKFSGLPSFLPACL